MLWSSFEQVKRWFVYFYQMPERMNIIILVKVEIKYGLKISNKDVEALFIFGKRCTAVLYKSASSSRALK